MRGKPGDPVDAADLLHAYAAVLAIVRDPPASLPLRGGGLLERVHVRLRPRIGAQMWTVRHVRRHLDALDRGYARRLALGLSEEYDEEDRAAVQDFRESLTPPAPRLFGLGLFVAGVLLTQLLLIDLPERLNAGQDTGRLQKALEDLSGSAAPSVGSVNELMSAIAESKVTGAALLLICACWSAYLLLRPLASGYRLSALILGQRDGYPGLGRERAPLVARAAALATRDEEGRLLIELGQTRPRDLPIDLAVKALLVVPLLAIALVTLNFGDELPFWEGFVLCAVLPVARLAALGLASERRGHGIAWLAVPLSFVVLGALFAPT
jgi:hypothetical protein